MITNIIQNFVKQTSSNLGLLINGDWGIGKSYFVRNKIIPNLEKDFKVYYVSLYGIQKIQDVFIQIFIQKNKVISKISKNKLGRIISSALTSAIFLGIKNFTLFKFDQTDIEVDLKDLLNFDNSIVIFDDLERTSSEIELGDLLGNINNIFMEQQSVKVILIANESKIVDKEYQDIKEKIIGWTVDFEIDFDTVIPSLIENYKSNKPYKEYIHTKSHFLIRVLQSLRIKNLRTVIFFYDIIEQIYSEISLDNSLSGNSLFYSTFILCHEYKLGSLGQFKHLKNLPVFIDNSNENIFRTRSNDDFGDLDKRFTSYTANPLITDTDFNFQYFFYNSIFRFILSGYINKSKLNDEFNTHEKYLKVNSTSDYYNACSKLNGYMFLSEDEYDLKFNFVRNGINDDRNTLHEFITGVNVLLYLSRRNELQIDRNRLLIDVKNQLKKRTLKVQDYRFGINFARRSILEIEKYENGLGEEIETLVKSTIKLKESEQYRKYLHSDKKFFSIEDEYKFVRVVTLASANDLLDLFVRNLNAPSRIEWMLLYLRRAFHVPYIELFDHNELIEKLVQTMNEAKILSKEKNFGKIDLVWINEIISDISKIIQEHN